MLRTRNNPASDLDAKTARRRSRGADAICLLSIALFVIGLASSAGIHQAELTRISDEAAHFTTGVMVFDYLRTSLGSDPVAFAESYYLRYPKVAFGHWPPVFYCVQAIWYFAFGPSKLAAQLLVGTIVFLNAACLCYRLNRSYGRFVSLSAVCILLSLPPVRLHCTVIMADMLVSLFCLLAFFSYCDFLRSRSLGHAALFAGWASLALLTKGNALALGLFALLALPTTGRLDVLRSKSFWVAGLVVGAATVALLALASATSVATHHNPSKLLVHCGTFYRRLGIAKTLFQLASPVVFPIALAGAVGAVFRVKTRLEASHVAIESAAAIAWLAAIVLFQIMCPITGSPRYFLPALFPLMILMAGGLDVVGSWLRTRSQLAAWIVPLILVVLAVATAPGGSHPAIHGYAAVAQAIPVDQSGTVVLISSDSRGEGAFIVERLVRDRSRSGFNLRASKVLADESFMGWSYFYSIIFGISLFRRFAHTGRAHG